MIKSISYIKSQTLSFIASGQRKAQDVIKASAFMMLVGLYGNFVMGTDGNDVLSDSSSPIDFVYGQKGNDVLVYTPSLNSQHSDHYDGGVGIDTLWLRMSTAEFYNPMFQADLILYHHFLMNNSSTASGDDKGPIFTFSTFNLKAVNMENIVIEKANTRQIPAKPTRPQNLIPIRDSSLDTLV